MTAFQSDLRRMWLLHPLRMWHGTYYMRRRWDHYVMPDSYTELLQIEMPCCGDELGQHTANGVPVECECGCRWLLNKSVKSRTDLLWGLRSIRDMPHNPPFSAMVSEMRGIAEQVLAEEEEP